MTTAHKPTWNPAKAQENAGFLAGGPSMSFSSRDVASHTKLKFRSQASASASRDQLEERERAHLKDLKRGRGDEDVTGLLEDERTKRRKLTTGDSMSEDEMPTLGAGKSSGEESDSEENDAPRPSSRFSAAKDIDADDSSGSESSSDDDSDDDDDMAELERELEKIKRERKEDQDRKQREREAAEAAQAERDVMMANPLMAQQAEDEADGDFTIRRKWWEETVFRNQAKAEPQYKKRFINDTLRNDFHKRFLNKFIK